MDIIGNAFAWAINYIFSFTGNYGLSILYLSAAVQIAIIPLKLKRRQGTKRLYEAQEEVNSVKKKFRGTPEELEQLINRIYEKHNAGNFSGCILFILTFLIPMIAFLAFYRNFTMPLTYFCNLTQGQTEAIMKAVRGIPKFAGINHEYEVIPAIIENPGLGLPSESIDRMKNLYSGFLGMNLCEKINLRNNSEIILLLVPVIFQVGSVFKNSRKKIKDRKYMISQGIILLLIMFGIYIACQLPVGLLLSTVMATAIDCLTNSMYRKEEATQ